MQSDQNASAQAWDGWSEQLERIEVDDVDVGVRTFDQAAAAVDQLQRAQAGMVGQRQAQFRAQRPFALHRRAGRTNLEIIWYDSERRRERSASAGTDDVAQGRIALDRLYLTQTGHRMCPHCHRPWANERTRAGGCDA